MILSIIIWIIVAIGALIGLYGIIMLILGIFGATVGGVRGLNNHRKNKKFYKDCRSKGVTAPEDKNNKEIIYLVAKLHNIENPITVYQGFYRAENREYDAYLESQGIGNPHKTIRTIVIVSLIGAVIGFMIIPMIQLPYNDGDLRSAFNYIIKDAISIFMMVLLTLFGAGLFFGLGTWLIDRRGQRSVILAQQKEKEAQKKKEEEEKQKINARIEELRTNRNRGLNNYTEKETHEKQEMGKPGNNTRPRDYRKYDHYCSTNEFLKLDAAAKGVRDKE